MPAKGNLIGTCSFLPAVEIYNHWWTLWLIAALWSGSPWQVWVWNLQQAHVKSRRQKTMRDLEFLLTLAILCAEVQKRSSPPLPFWIRKQKGSQAKDMVFLDLSPNGLKYFQSSLQCHPHFGNKKKLGNSSTKKASRFFGIYIMLAFKPYPRPLQLSLDSLPVSNSGLAGTL